MYYIHDFTFSSDKNSHHVSITVIARIARTDSSTNEMLSFFFHNTEIIEKLKHPDEKPFRPFLNVRPQDANPKMMVLMEACINESPVERPTFSQITKGIKEGSGR